MDAHFELPVWDRAHRLTATLYRLVRRLSERDRESMGKELCHAAADVVVCLSRCENEVLQPDRLALLRAAQRSASETECLLLLLLELPYLHRKMVGVLTKENQTIQRMLALHRQRLERESPFPARK